MEQSIKYIRVRDVKCPCRGHKDDGAIDFYVPSFTSDDMEYIREVNKDNHIIINMASEVIAVDPGQSIVIPSGIKCIIEPSGSALVASNKSSISNKMGLVFTADLVDSNYTGEIHFCMYNTSKYRRLIKFGQKILQFKHVPVYLTQPEEIVHNDFAELADKKSRGEGWNGSTGGE